MFLLTSTFLLIQNGLENVAMKGSVLAEPPERQSNIPVLTDRWEPPPDLPHSHLNNERRAGVMSNLSALYKRGQASIARQGSMHTLACRKSPRDLRNCPQGGMVGIKVLDVTELSVSSVSICPRYCQSQLKSKGKVIYWPKKEQGP